MAEYNPLKVRTSFAAKALIKLKQVVFPGSAQYWEKRYTYGGSSGQGAYGRLAKFKAEILNNFVSELRVGSVIEFGCGDGNQLELAKYPDYVGLDVSEKAVALCKVKFTNDISKRFSINGPQSVMIYFYDGNDLSNNLNYLSKYLSL